MHPLLQVVDVVEGAVKGHFVLLARDAGEAATLEEPPVTVAPARHLRHDHLALERATESDRVHHEAPLEGIEEQVLVGVALVKAKDVNPYRAVHAVGVRTVALDLDRARALGPPHRSVELDECARELQVARVSHLVRVCARAALVVVGFFIHEP